MDDELPQKPVDWGDHELVPISALEHYSYCPRQAALIHVEAVWEENLYTLRGRFVHELVDEPGVGRTRRPPLDPVNALLSFLYALLLSDCTAAAQGVGLDPQVGFLHALRPGRPSLGLDLMEELRPVLADRLTLTLINRRQLTEKDFDRRPGGAVLLNESGRKSVLVAYQERKQEEITHPVARQKMPLGLVPHLQARFLARHLRGELPGYLPYVHH